MNYQDCLNICVEFNQDVPGFRDCYREYPVPTQKVWKQCVSEAVNIFDENDAIFCMARYEAILAAKGITTVSAMNAEKIVEQALIVEGVSFEILLAAVNSASAYGSKPTNTNLAEVA